MSFKEVDIRPADLLDEYLRLSQLDGEKVLDKSSDFFDRNCPGCMSSVCHPAFEKNGFNLVTCSSCQTLYVNPAPPMDAMIDFYATSPSANYWAHVFFPAVAATRRQLIYRPRAKRVIEIAGCYENSLGKVTDVGAGAGLFLEEFGKISKPTDLSAVEPGDAHVTQLRRKGIRTFQGFSNAACTSNGWADSADLVTCFEVLEHISEPEVLLGELRGLAKPGGLVIVTGLSGSGFDIQTLGIHSKPVSPPHHLTFLSVSGTRDLISRCGLDVLELSTPGELDVDIVRNAAQENPAAVSDSFIRSLVLESSKDIRDNFQTFLKENALSSHMWIVARRPGD